MPVFDPIAPRFQGKARLRAGLAPNSPPDCSPTARLQIRNSDHIKPKPRLFSLGFVSRCRPDLNRT